MGTRGTTIADEVGRRRLFREVKARIREISAEFRSDTGNYNLLCECGRDACLERIEVPVAVYDEIREDDQRFLVAPGHEGSERERIVAADGTWRVIAPGSVSPRAR